MSTKNESLGKRFSNILAKFGGNPVLALDLTIADGSGMLTFPDLKEGDIPKEGDLAKIGEAEADGEVVVLIDEKPVTYIFEKGVFKGVKPESDNSTEAEMKAKISDLEKKLADATAKFTALEKTHKDAVTEFTALAREVVSGKDEKELEKFFTKEGEDSESVTALAKLDNLKKKKGLI